MAGKRTDSNRRPISQLRKPLGPRLLGITCKYSKSLAQILAVSNHVDGVFPGRATADPTRAIPHVINPN
jgi:hypothetical protein